jgi:hypothetical protein
VNIRVYIQSAPIDKSNPKTVFSKGSLQRFLRP